MNYSDYNTGAGSSANPNLLDENLNEVLTLENKLSSSNVPVGLKEEAMRSVQRLKRMFKMGGYSGEFETVNKYVDWITRIPWGVTSRDNFDITNAKRFMDQTHYGMDSIKDLILDYLATMQLQSVGGVKNSNIPSQIPLTSNVQIENGEMAVLKGSSANAPVFLFIGLQGVGKTSIAKCIASSMGRKFSRVSLGAIGDVRTLRGTPRYSLDAEPGQIIKSLVRCGTMNPVILLDEIEKF